MSPPSVTWIFCRNDSLLRTVVRPRTQTWLLPCASLRLTGTDPSHMALPICSGLSFQVLWRLSARSGLGIKSCCEGIQLLLWCTVYRLSRPTILGTAPGVCPNMAAGAANHPRRGARGGDVFMRSVEEEVIIGGGCGGRGCVCDGVLRMVGEGCGGNVWQESETRLEERAPATDYLLVWLLSPRLAACNIIGHTPGAEPNFAL
jgi:hypothetical protein